jgi:hypothetical protein
MKMAKAKRRITEFNFEKQMMNGGNAHVALVDKAANETEVLVMKQKQPEVAVEMSMREFLCKFFNLYYDDAAVLAGIMGYETGYESDEDTETYESYIDKKINQVSLLKTQNINSIKTLPEDIYQGVAELQKQYSESLDKDTDEASASEVNNNLSKEAVMPLTEAEIAELQKAASQAVELQKALEDKDKELETANAAISDFEKANQERIKEETTDFVKSLSFVSEEDLENVSDALIKARNTEGSATILAQLKKAQDAIDSFATEEIGIDASDEEITKSQTDYDALIAQVRAEKKENK